MIAGLAGLAAVMVDRTQRAGVRVLLLSLVFLAVLVAAHFAPAAGTTFCGLPYSDAAGYLGNALRLDVGVPLDAFAARRPLYSLALASSTLLAGEEFLTVLALWALALGAACVVLIETLRQTDGPRTAAGATFLLFIFIGPFLATTLTESLGFALGATEEGVVESL